jgi:hypothetical protein
MRRAIGIVLLAGVAVVLRAQTPAPQTPAAPNPTNLGSDANGNPLRKALKTGHVSNYDESKVAPYTLPDPLTLANGRLVRDANTWTRQRRDELVGLYEREIYGRAPANAPKVRWEVADVDPAARDGAAVLKHVVGHVGSAADWPRINLSVVTPARAPGPVPIILSINFGGGPPRAGGPGGAARGPAAGIAGEPPIAADLLARGWGYAMVGYQDIQPDRANAFTEGVIGLTLAPGQTQPAPDEWGTISAWAWGVSRIVDYLVTDKAVDGKQIALHGFSRLGKTVLWASAKDPRIAAVFSACAGEMGSALARRDWGETVDDMAQNFAWQFAGNFQRYVGKWNDMPVDAHMLIALSAPRPVFLTGGSTDQWSDPKGEFLAAVAAGPVYKLLGKKGLGTSDLPPLDARLTDGDLGWIYHTGGHAVPAGDWNAFVVFLSKYFQ